MHSMHYYQSRFRLEDLTHTKVETSMLQFIFSHVQVTNMGMNVSNYVSILSFLFAKDAMQLSMFD